jgi:hypothetical protein
MHIFYERDEIKINIGSDTSKLNFIQHNDVNVDLTSGKGVRFYNSGIFQLGDGPPLLILPWFLKGTLEDLENKSSELEKYEFFDFIKQIKYIKDNSTSLNSHRKGFALEIILHSFLKRIDDFLNRIMTQNYFVDIDEELNTIKGRWNAHKDLRRNHRPLKFSCTYSGLEKNVFELSILKGFLRDVQKKVKVDHNYRLLDSMMGVLVDVTELYPSNVNIEKCLHLKSRITMDRDWQPIIHFIASYYGTLDGASDDAGVAYKFSLDKFFEDIITHCFKSVKSHNVSTQERSLLLGGGKWINTDRDNEIEEEKSSKIYTIPDIIIESEKNYTLVECKYKPYKTPFDNNSNDIQFKSISRNDRNQLLSFILSLNPDEDIIKKNISFNVAYPIVGEKDFTKSILQFPKSNLLIEAEFRSLTQNKIDVSKPLEINFVGVNISKCLGHIAGKSLEGFSNELYSLVA